MEPTFVERCLTVWEPGHYVYTDWYEEDERHNAPLDPWCGDGQWHCITTLLPRDAANAVGGFAAMPGGEDTEFYWALTRQYKVCGIRLPEALFHYGAQGQRARAFKDSDQFNIVMQKVIRSYGNMGCCADQIIQAKMIEGGAPGDVLARAIWGGNMVKIGPASQRKYPKGGNGSLMMIDPRDAQARPNWWQAATPNRPVSASTVA